MTRWFPALLLVLGLSAGACKPSYVTTPEPANQPGNEKAYVEYALAHLTPTLQQTTCHCCGKTLHKCLSEMGNKGACPYH